MNKGVPEALTGLKAVVDDIRFISDKKEDLAILILVARFVELADALIDSSKNNTKIGVPILLSSLLEVYCYLISIMSKGSNYNYLLIESAKTRKRILNAVDRGVENGYLPPKSEIEDFENELEAARRLVSHLDKKGFGSGEGFRGLFQRAGLGDLYSSVYFSVCNHKHSNYNTMLKRQLRVNSSRGEASVVYDAPLPKRDLEAYMDTTGDLILHVKQLIESYFS